MYTKGETTQTIAQTAISIQVLATNFVRANTPKYDVRKRDQVWKKPDVGMVKINVDASFTLENLSGSCGVIARNNQCQFLGTASDLLAHVPNVEEAEMIAIRCGLNLAANLGCTKLVIESDSTMALEAVSDPNAYMGPAVPIIAECSLTTMQFAHISFVHCSREANSVADALAKHCISFKKSEVWENIPDFILHLFVNDLAII